jgi:hypothetical protein
MARGRAHAHANTGPNCIAVEREIAANKRAFDEYR